LKSYAQEAQAYITQKWESLKSWWDSWTFADVFAPLKGYALEALDYVSQKWQAFSTWWDSWSFADVFAPVKEYAGSAKDYAMQKLTELQTCWNSWTLSDVFSPVLEKGKAVWDSFSSTIETVKTLASEKLSGIWDKTVTAYEQARSVIVSNVISPVLDFSWNALVEGWNLASGLVSTGFEKLKGLLQIDFSGFWDTLASGFATVCDTIKGAWSGVTGFIKDTWNAAADYVSGAWDWTKGLFGFGEDAGAVNQEQLKAQVQDITILNKMSEGFAQRVADMTAAWQPFKTSLGEGFEQIYSIMQSVADKINGTVIPAVNSLVSALSAVARELSAVSQAGNLNVNVGTITQNANANVQAQPQRMTGGRNKSNVPAYATGGIISQPHVGLVGEAGREAIIPLEDRNSGIPLLMSAISELGVSSNDILPYLNPVAPEIEAPSVNLSVPAQTAPIVNVPELPIAPANVSISPLIYPAPVSVQPAEVKFSPMEQLLPIDISGIESTIKTISERLADQIPLLQPNTDVNFAPVILPSEVNVFTSNKDISNVSQIQPAEVSVSPVLPSQPVAISEHVDISGIERTVNAILANFANFEQSNIDTRIKDRMPMPAVNVAPVVSPADVSVQPLLQSSPVVNVPPVNLPAPMNVSVLNDMSELGNVIVQAIKSIGNTNDVVQSQAFNSPLSVQPSPVSIQPPDLSGFGNVITSLIENMNSKNESIKLIAPQNQNPSSPLLIQHSQNQAVMNGQAQVKAQEQSPERPVNVNNHVDVTIEGKPVELYIDGERVGSAVLRWTERQNTRNGMSEF
jgi:hypothetical protein